MTKKKRKGRIKQTRTDWQKVFDLRPEMVQPFSWSDRLPEILHISIALIEHDFQTVKSDFFKISDLVNDRIKSERNFHFNLSHTIKLIKQDQSILDEIFKTSFKSAFENLLLFYHDYFEIDIDSDDKLNVRLLFIGYKQILDGRADISILSKYMMVQYSQLKNPNLRDLLIWNTKEEVLDPINVSSVMSFFPVLIGQSLNLDLDFCQTIWMLNYSNSPLMPKPDDSKQEEEHFAEMKVDQFATEFKELYLKFKEVNMLMVYPRFIAEINMGFVSRICNLSLETVDFVKNHKGEIAEMVFRTTLETFIIASWLMKRNDMDLLVRFRDFSTGREKMFGEKLLAKATSEEMKTEAGKIIDNAIADAGVRHIEVATERGDIFDFRIDQMADEVWGAENQYYFFYKRSSEVIHGHWRVIAKYHLAKSYNPLHNGLYWYNDNPNRFAGLLPAFSCLGLAVDFLLTILENISSGQPTELQEKFSDFKKRLWEQYMVYSDKYIMSNGNETS